MDPEGFDAAELQKAIAMSMEIDIVNDNHGIDVNIMFPYHDIRNFSLISSITQLFAFSQSKETNHLLHFNHYDKYLDMFLMYINYI